MAILNRSTLKQKISDFINRVAPFTDPLIQKSEDLEVREDVADSVIFKDSTVASISSPGANFTLDFDTNDEYSVNTLASIPAAFNITLSNLRNNAVGKISIVKKTNDVFTFANGQIVPFDNTVGQQGIVTLSFNVFKSGSDYFVMPLYNFSGRPQIERIAIPIGTWNMDTTASVNVTHGLDAKRFLTASVVIRGNFGGAGFAYTLRDLLQGGDWSSSTSIFTLNRDGGGIFTTGSGAYAGAENRGFILVEYSNTIINEA